MTGRLEGSVALVTGAARGQGRSHAVRLAQEGADVIAVDICRQIDSVAYPLATRGDLDQTVAEVEALDRRIVAAEADVRDELQASYLDRLRKAGLSGGLVRDIVDRLIGSPFITVRSVSGETGRTQQAVSNAITKLIDLGVVYERTGRSYGRIFEAVEVTASLRRD